MRRAFFRSGRRSTSKSKRSTLGGIPCERDTETQGRREGEKERRRERETERQIGWSALSIRLSVSPSFCTSVSLSPCLSVSPWLVRQGRSRNGRYLRRKRCPLATSTMRCPTAPLRAGSARQSDRAQARSGI